METVLKVYHLLLGAVRLRGAGELTVQGAGQVLDKYLF